MKILEKLLLVKNYHKMIAVDLSKQQALDADPEAYSFYSKLR